MKINGSSVLDLPRVSFILRYPNPDLYVDGKISRATVIMNGRFLHHAAALTMQHGIPVGLHFNLTEGIPISGKKVGYPRVNIRSTCGARHVLRSARFLCL